MSCSILTPERWEQLLKNGLTKEETAELISHLESACPDCDQFFSQIQDSAEHDLRHMFNEIPVDELDFLQQTPAHNDKKNDKTAATSDGRAKSHESIPPDISSQRGLLGILSGISPFAPALAGGGVAVIALVIFLLNVRYRHLKRRMMDEMNGEAGSP